MDGKILKCLCENAEKLGVIQKDPCSSSHCSRNTPTWKLLEIFGTVEGGSQFNLGGDDEDDKEDRLAVKQGLLQV